MKYSINYTGGGHGHFLEYACNYIFFKQGVDPNQRISINGTYHKNVPITNRQFIAFPFWWLYPDANVKDWPKVPYQLTNTVININSKSLEEITLLRMYWRRRGDGFFLSPEQLLHTTKQELTNKINSISYADVWKEGIALGQQHRNTLATNALSVYRSENLTEMDVIRFWIDPFIPNNVTDKEWMVDTSVKFIEWIRSDHTVLQFEMKWFYNTDKFLSGIKMIGNELQLEQQVSDEEIIEMVKVLPNNVHELPKNLVLVREKFESIKRYESVDLSMLELNDKIALLTMMNIEYKLYYKDYEHLIEFPKTSEKLVEMIYNRVKTV
jgi:hypothetical protein